MPRILFAAIVAVVFAAISPISGVAGTYSTPVPSGKIVDTDCGLFRQITFDRSLPVDDAKFRHRLATDRVCQRWYQLHGQKVERDRQFFLMLQQQGEQARQARVREDMQIRQQDEYARQARVREDMQRRQQEMQTEQMRAQRQMMRQQQANNRLRTLSQEGQSWYRILKQRHW